MGRHPSLSGRRIAGIGFGFLGVMDGEAKLCVHSVHFLIFMPALCSSPPYVVCIPYPDADLILPCMQYMILK